MHNEQRLRMSRMLAAIAAEAVTWPMVESATIKLHTDGPAYLLGLPTWQGRVTLHVEGGQEIVMEVSDKRIAKATQQELSETLGAQLLHMRTLYDKHTFRLPLTPKHMRVREPM